MYGWLVRYAARRLAAFPGTRAVYLTRGLTGDEFVAGISDIDFALIGEWRDGERERLEAWYERLARRIPLYDPTLSPHTVEEFHWRYRNSHHHQFRFTEGAAVWRLLDGTDYLRQLERLPVERLPVGLHTELKVWWMFFILRGVSANGLRRDELFNRSLCYKVVAETLRMDLALTRQRLVASRRQALEEARGSLTAEGAALTGKLLRCARARYRRYDGEVFEDAYRFILPHLEDLHRRVEWRWGQEAAGATPVRVDSPPEERFRTSAEEAFLDRAVAFLKRRWEGVYRAACLAGGIGFGMDEVLLMVEPAPGRLPTLEQLRAWSRFSAEHRGGLRRRVNAYLLLPAAAYQIDDPAWGKPFQHILLPQWNPDVFLSLAQPEACRDGVPSRRLDPAVWAPPEADFIAEERTLLREALEDPVVYRANNLDFLRTFWKYLQLNAVAASADSGEAVFPQTLPAVRRALAAQNLPRAPFLEQFEEAYRGELEGRPADIDRRLPAAVSYLKEVTHDG